jgi:carbon storage regulator
MEQNANPLLISAGVYFFRFRMFFCRKCSHSFGFYLNFRISRQHGDHPRINDCLLITCSTSGNTGVLKMLVLTRRISEKFIVGNNVVITVLKVDGNQVRIGIEAPREISVIRSELVSPKPVNLVK